MGRAEVAEATGFGLGAADSAGVGADEEIPETRLPTEEELRLVREVIDPKGVRDREVRS